MGQGWKSSWKEGVSDENLQYMNINFKNTFEDLWEVLSTICKFNLKLGGKELKGFFHMDPPLSMAVEKSPNTRDHCSSLRGMFNKYNKLFAAAGYAPWGGQ